MAKSHFGNGNPDGGGAACALTSDDGGFRLPAAPPAAER